MAERSELVSGSTRTEEQAVLNAALFEAVEKGEAGAVALLLESGASVDALNMRFFTPLMDAVEAGHLGMAKLLLEHQANATYALYLAVEFENKAMIDLLLQHGADPADQSALETAAEGSDDINKYLRSLSCSCSLRSQDC